MEKRENISYEELSDFYERTRTKAFRKALGYLKNEADAEDVMQEAYVAAFEKQETLKDPSKQWAWFNRILENRCKDYLRKKKPIVFSDLENAEEEPFEWSIQDESSDFVPEVIAVNAELKEEFAVLLDELPDEQRVSLYMFAVEGKKIAEIADEMQVSENTVKSRLNYAKRKLRMKVEETEKRGIKMRSVSGFALLPLVRWIFYWQGENRIASIGSKGAQTCFMAALRKAGYETASGLGNQAMEFAGTSTGAGAGAGVASTTAESAIAGATSATVTAGVVTHAATSIAIKIACGVFGAAVLTGGTVGAIHLVRQYKQPENAVEVSTVIQKPELENVFTKEVSNRKDGEVLASEDDSVILLEESSFNENIVVEESEVVEPHPDCILIEGEDRDHRSRNLYGYGIDVIMRDYEYSGAREVQMESIRFYDTEKGKEVEAHEKELAAKTGYGRSIPEFYEFGHSMDYILEVDTLVEMYDMANEEVRRVILTDDIRELVCKNLGEDVERRDSVEVTPVDIFLLHNEHYPDGKKVYVFLYAFSIDNLITDKNTTRGMRISSEREITDTLTAVTFDYDMIQAGVFEPYVVKGVFDSVTDFVSQYLNVDTKSIDLKSGIRIEDVVPFYK